MVTRFRAATPFFITLFLTLLGCSVPPLESEFERGPRVKDIVKHLNCELASIVNRDPHNQQLMARLNADPDLHRKLLQHLTDAHFVASVLMTLDVSNSEGVNPSLTFISPLNAAATLSRTGTVGGSLNGTQERNISLGYSIDLEELQDKPIRKHDKVIDVVRYADAHHCYPDGQFVDVSTEESSFAGGLAGDLGLTAIVVDGLRGIDAASNVNIYGNSGPTALTVSDEISSLVLKITDPRINPDFLGNLNFVGNMSFSPSTTDALSPGTATLTGTATIAEGAKRDSYFVSINGASLQGSQTASVTLSLSGTMTRIGGATTGLAGKLGFGPKLTLAGTIDPSYKPESLTLAGTATPDPTVGAGATAFFNINMPEASQGGRQHALAGGSSTPGGSQSKAGGTSSGSSTQFGSLVNFILSYGVNGGPNWTLQTFKGPGGGSSITGSGGGGQLLNVSRTNTDTLTITFVPACKNEPNTPSPKNFWASLPHCDQFSKSGAANAGNANNVLIQSGRGL